MTARSVLDVVLVVAALFALVENVSLYRLAKNSERRSDSPKDRQGFTCRKCHGILLSSGVKPGDDLCAWCRIGKGGKPYTPPPGAIPENVFVKAYFELPPGTPDDAFDAFFADLTDVMSDVAERNGFGLGLVLSGDAGEWKS